MKNRITILTVLIFLFYSISAISQTFDVIWVKWEDDMDGDNSVAGLQSRGWIILNEDGGGVTDPWFQGGTQFLAFDGPDSGYVASNYNGANIDGVIDQWLISPPLTVTSTDTLIFWARSPLGGATPFDDSIHIMYSASAGTTPSSFVSIGRFLVPKNDWDDFFIYNFPSNATIRFAIRYYLFEGGPTGIRSNYIGLDLFQLYTELSTYPTTLNISKSFGFTNITSSSSYRMIGLPGQTNFAIPVTGTQKTDWNAFYDNGAASNYLVEYDGTANFNFKPGNGFWMLSKNTININSAVNSVTLAGDNTYSIQVHTGWNIISNPFERSTQWSAVQTANGLAGNTLIYDWGGVWTNPTSFTPYKGYYFNNISGLTTLKIPYDPAGTLGKFDANSEVKLAGSEDIRFSLNHNDEEKSKILISFNGESTNDFDVKDFFAPPGDFEDSRIVLRNNNLSTDYKYLMKDSRPEIGNGQIYNLEIKNLTGQELTCRFEGVTKHQDYLAYLVDEKLNNEIKISEDMIIKIPSNSTIINYKFMIGSQQFIEENKGNLTPTSFALYQNYPNPFNPATTIRYSVPKESKVTIKIFDLLGKEVSFLDEGLKSPGNYEVEFNASLKGELASGVYVYQLHAGPFTESKKMILLR